MLLINKLLSKIKILLLLIAIFPWFKEVSAQELDRNLFGIHKSVSNGQYSFVKYDIGGPDYEVILTFDQNLGDIWELAFNPNTNLFYTYANASYNSPTVLLEINAATATVVNLGTITVEVNNDLHTDICTADGLTFNQTTNELIGTIGVGCGTWRAYRVVKFDQNSFGTSSLTCSQIGTLETSTNLEFDAIAMANNNELQGMDPDIPSNSLNFYCVSDVSNAIGQTTLASNFNGWSTFRGLAFNLSENKMYSFQGQNGMRWLSSCDPSYSSGAYNFQNMVQYNLTGFEIRGIVFGTISNSSLSLEENQPITEAQKQEIEITLYPNPTEGVTNFKTESKEVINEILVFDSQGKQAFQANVQEINARKIDLSNLEEGVYLVRVIFQSGQTQIIRLVKN